MRVDRCHHGQVQVRAWKAFQQPQAQFIAPLEGDPGYRHATLPCPARHLSVGLSLFYDYVGAPIASKHTIGRKPSALAPVYRWSAQDGPLKGLYRIFHYKIQRNQFHTV